MLIEPLGFLFNNITNSGYFPSQWTEGIIIPLHKKGAHDDSKNYRGITLISCRGKLFTSIINQRLITWSTANEISTDAKCGFKAGHSIIDAIFNLQNFIQKRVKNKKRLYYAFIDLQRAFDSVYRNTLWYKLIKYGVDGKLLKLLSWCKREHVESNALNSWKLNIFKIIDGRISFYCNNLDLLPPKLKFTFRHLKKGIQEFHKKFVLAPADKAANNVVVI